MTNKDYDNIPMGNREEIKRSNRDIFSSSGRDVYSSANFSDISSRSNVKKLPPKKKKKKKHIALKVMLSLLLVVVLALGGIYAYAYSLINKIEQVELDRDSLGVTTNDYQGVKNIALLGIDSREDSEVGRADAVLVLSVDKKHNKIKLTSVARDSYMEIEGHGADKLTHAYAYGRSELAVKTLNQNLGLETTDYVMVNFYGFANIIDYVGGVTVEVDEKEKNELNRNIMPYTAKEMGVKSQPLSSAGVQKLNGIQALCYSRIRHIDGDVERGNRQKEVLSALLSSVKSINPLNLPDLATMVMSECKTSLSSNDIMSMGLWAVVRSPELVQHSLPNDDIKATGKTIGGKWVYYYDLSTAEENLKKFILE